MTYTYVPKTYKLEFDTGDELHGLTVRCKAIPMGSLISLMKQSTGMVEALKQGDFTAADIASGKVDFSLVMAGIDATDESMRLFAESLLEWDLVREDGSEIPPTLEGIQELDQGFMQKLLDHWMQAIGGTAPGLGKDSASGGTSPALPIQMPPMEVL